MGAVAQLSQVCVRRGRATLLDGVDLSIKEGDRWVIIGPNGAGKTTLLSLLATQSYPSSGRVEVLGETLGHVDVFELRPRIGVCSSAIGTRIPGHEMARDVVVSAAYGMLGRWREHYEEDDYRRAMLLLQRLRVETLARRTYATLSEGERKRVEIARALMTDPEMLLLDEPGAGLDLAGREMLVDTLASLCADRMAPTMVLVTHHMEEIPDGMTHALLLNQGHVVASGPIEQTLTASNLSRTYGLPLFVTHEDGRWSARSAGRRQALG
ncbi:MAG: ABC transporter ATP-binding protein [Propionibacteriaceae bacterium]|nr:ABC transporter ATP-binding protein [Propionibacteriaceae bacterium]